GIWESSIILEDIFGIDRSYKKDVSSWLHIVYEEDRAMMQDYFTINVLENKEPFNKEYRIKRISDQQLCWVHGKGELETDNEGNPLKMIGTIQDITKRKQAEHGLHNERDNLENILEAMKDGVYIVNQKFDIQYANSSMIKELGPYEGIKCHDYFYNSKSACSWCKFPEILSGKTVHWEWVSPKNGDIYDLIETPIKNSDGSISKLKIFRDITKRKNAEDEVKRQLSEKEIILKEVHHRIKNNFASIESLLSLQAQSINQPAAISALQDAIGRVSSMQVLYEKLLLSDDYQVTSVKEYLDNLIDEIIGLFPVNFNQKIEKQIDDFQLDPKILVPIGIIVNELLTNIMKYAFTGRDSGLIEVNLKEDKGNVTLTLQDNGKGLPEGFDFDMQEGFGLMLVKVLSEQLGGSFAIEDYNGTRSTLKFSINN
ncbi:MAG: PAS domain S-box protein, partial [Spirochaetales bacterium]|nr:PAS domain S-box protein [Spirochaetales bacterium]